MARAWLGAVAALAVLGFIALVVLSEMYLGYGEGLLDGRVIGYDAEAVRIYLGLLPADAKAFYLGPFRALDTVVPPLLALSFAGVIWLYGRGMLRCLVVLPLIYVCADLAENAAVGQILRAGLEGLDADLVAYASQLTQIKWAFTVASLLTAIIIWRKTRKRGA